MSTSAKTLSFMLLVLFSCLLMGEDYYFKLIYKHRHYILHLNVRKEEKPEIPGVVAGMPDSDAESGNDSASASAAITISQSLFGQATTSFTTTATLASSDNIIAAHSYQISHNSGQPGEYTLTDSTGTTLSVIPPNTESGQLNPAIQSQDVTESVWPADAPAIPVPVDEGVALLTPVGSAMLVNQIANLIQLQMNFQDPVGSLTIGGIVNVHQHNGFISANLYPQGEDSSVTVTMVEDPNQIYFDDLASPAPPPDQIFPGQGSLNCLGSASQ